VIAPLARGAFLAATALSSRRFRAALDSPAEAQERLRRRLTAALARSPYGISLGVRGDESYEEFVRRVPLVTYDELDPWIERLSARPPRLYEETSGSSGRAKLIPYPPALLASFGRYAVLWMRDLLARGPRLEPGKTFFSLSPALRDERVTASGAAIGLENDSEYLPPVLRRLLGSRLVLPRGLGQARDPVEYRRLLATALLAERELEVFFVWSPTYLGSLLDFIVADRLGGRAPADWREIWPRLKLISCWTDGAAGFYVRRLEREFPGVAIQGKGLLATEAPVTLPLFDAPAPVPFVDEVFLEFIAADGRVLRLHELDADGQYELVLSQRGGLARYRIGDRVRVAGRHRGVPCLRFAGRGTDVSDLVGEKLNERFAAAALERAAGEGFSFLYPRRELAGPSRYVCVTDAPGRVDAARLDEALQEGFHYRQARLLGQLGPVEVQARADALEAYYAHHAARGVKWGDVKCAALLREELVSVPPLHSGS
jgi:hypothetical protein